jgi:hypothetical protein
MTHAVILGSQKEGCCQKVTLTVIVVHVGWASWRSLSEIAGPAVVASGLADPKKNEIRNKFCLERAR